jgi:predicted deacetylase
MSKTPDEGAVPACSVLIYDVAPATWQACRELLDLVESFALPASLLVVPHYHGGTRADADPPFAAALKARLARGDDIVLHGYYHHDDGQAPRGVAEWLRRRVYTASEGEFDALDASTARQRLVAGCQCFARLGLPPPLGFVAPAWLLGHGARQALAGSGFRYTSMRDSLIRIADGAVVAAPSLVTATRSTWRRIASVAWLRARLTALAERPFIRVALHPADAHDADILALWKFTLAHLAATRRPVLESDIIESA